MFTSGFHLHYHDFADISMHHDYIQYISGLYFSSAPLPMLYFQHKCQSAVSLACLPSSAAQDADDGHAETPISGLPRANKASMSGCAIISLPHARETRAGDDLCATAIKRRQAPSAFPEYRRRERAAVSRPVCARAAKAQWSGASFYHRTSARALVS